MLSKKSVTHLQFIIIGFIIQIKSTIYNIKKFMSKEGDDGIEMGATGNIN